ncbi:hypothetical protein PHYBLDRAFT_169317 [Phycomyces blakesleeanus NRRL 1555(-)]|uniref:Uncharacterized protein n=1 Tax=Phycomyces blakesleeanus (strain ATCC 8743b / DSM 1359 / FGSC 10004 / NBRC 33097 / NRRL 1555) TaxID=763407 RepID=A0A167MJX6_PHYB8|nr:hypothetical protein PHYBLDRAFT_169317 [Phycomyces blakesleeanus NRRL 1555(-)]OAD73059.1 hypothetical protein PHYBLDRAFT_169317 [Phycomyces blakesleeanus NRRL 1555(-)]|eukprot:XP_018291099.1 hypothetical protein PHYBLDRAFT_169317 [Phycomyces blakesleeanus NRRL 1555(-)]
MAYKITYTSQEIFFAVGPHNPYTVAHQPTNTTGNSSSIAACINDCRLHGCFITDKYSSNSKKYDDKNNIIDDYFNDDTTNNYVLSAVNEYLESAVNGKMNIDNFGNLEGFILNTDTNNQSNSGFHPFPDLQSMVLFELIDSDNDMLSQRMVKKILAAMNLIIKIYAETPTGKVFKLSCLDNLMNYQTRKGNKTSVLPSLHQEIQVPNNTEHIYLNLPSTHFEFLMSNAKKCDLIASLPDHTPGQAISLQQGEKWRNHPLFQQPMFTVNSVNIWAGDILYLKANNPMLRFLVESFHTANSHIYARGYMIRIISDKCHGVEIAATDINIELIDHVNNNRLEEACYLSISLQYTATLCPVHYTLLFTQHPMKQQIPNAPANTFYKVMIVPLILFTDDTSGNLLKQYNPYESWLMKCAGLAFRDRLSIENIQFIATVPKKNGAKGVSILPVMVCDLKALEKGVVMFCEKENQYVLVIAPVLWIEADTPCHSELCRLSGSTSLYPYRKCYVCIHRLKDSLPAKEYCTEPHKRRTQEHYVLANFMLDRTTIIPNAPTDRCNLPAKDLSFKDRSTGSLLELDAFNPSRDMPVEILPTILLGIEKYMVIHLMNNDYKCSTRLSRKFTRNINRSGSYVGRDFKVLLQILSVILVTDFSNEPILDRIKPCFVELGCLCSLVFVREVTSGFDDYLVGVDLSVRRLLGQLHDYNTFKRAEVKEKNKTAKIKKKYTAFCTKPKIHNLTHMKDDIQ